jgi:hypothetical protein
MSGISGIGNSGNNDLSVWLEKLREAKKASLDAATAPAASESLKSKIEGFIALKKEIRTAVFTALRELDKPATPRQVIATIKEAVVSTLKANGIDIEAIKQSLKAKAPLPPDPATTSGASETKGDEMASVFKELSEGSGVDPDKIKEHLRVDAQASPPKLEDATMDVLHLLFSRKGVDTVA